MRGAGAAAAGTYLWLHATTGNPLFPFFATLFGEGSWSVLVQSPAPRAARLGGALALPWTGVLARSQAGLQPQLTPLLLLAPLVVFGVVKDRTVRWLALLVAGYLLAPALVPVLDSRYLALVLPALVLALVLTATAGGLLRHLRSPLAIALLAGAIALPGLLYVPFYVWRAGGLALAPPARERFLAAQVPGFPALRWLERHTGGRHSLYALHAETLHGLARGPLHGEHTGPWAYAHVEPLIGQPLRLACVLHTLGSTHLLVPRRLGHRLPAESPWLTRVYADDQAELFALRPAAYSSTCMPSSTTRLGGRLK
jgi:hypothetical protein